MLVGQPEFVDNPENRCPVILLVDTSGSMAGQPIEALNSGLSAFKDAVLKDEQAALRVDVAIVSFGPVQLEQDFVTVDQFTPPSLQAYGLTPMGEAIEFALDLLETRKQTYRSNGIQYYRPWVFLITDGAPNPDSPWQQASQRLQDAETQRKLSFFAVGVQGADMNTLRQISPSERPPLLLKGLDFQSMFLWLSDSMVRVSSSTVGGDMVALPPVGWGQITT
ncbi:VWA domain-containing protein [Synechococcales cyanobacterium C]|uniref:VWA domain-containing protein n=1 Tax=Petrachloros mirabilis ULC683 TaxID=2781853 RepID=A0A8K1ZW94_9CYAN|nr:VWA domain-containing protein [Petrachloros mirabilis]NCJ06048.1 VWA domain-containing protein [Petrachloros mirabilis ULC683]